MADLAPPLSLDPEAILSIPNRLILTKHFGDRAIVDTVIIKSQGEDAQIFDQLKIGSVWHDVIRENMLASQSAPEPERSMPVVVANLHTGRFKLMTLDQAQGYVESLKDNLPPPFGPDLNEPPRVFCGPNAGGLTRKILGHLGIPEEPIVPIRLTLFADGEGKAEAKYFLRETSEGSSGYDGRVFLVWQIPPGSIDQSVTELKRAIKAVRDTPGVQHVTLVLPYLPFGRADKPTLPDTPERAGYTSIETEGYSLVEFVHRLQGQVQTIVTLDPHADATVRVFEAAGIRPKFAYSADKIAARALLKYIEENEIEGSSVVIVTPDFGGAKRAGRVHKLIPGSELLILEKSRKEPNEVSSMKDLSGTLTPGSLVGKHVILVDDIFDTLKTAKKGIELLAEAGAEDIVVFGAHGLFSGRGYDTLVNSLKPSGDPLVKTSIVTDSLATPLGVFPHNRFRVESCAEVLAEPLRDVLRHRSPIRNRPRNLD